MGSQAVRQPTHPAQPLHSGWPHQPSAGRQAAGANYAAVCHHHHVLEQPDSVPEYEPSVQVTVPLAVPLYPDGQL